MQDDRLSTVLLSTPMLHHSVALWHGREMLERVKINCDIVTFETE